MPGSALSAHAPLGARVPTHPPAHPSLASSQLLAGVSQEHLLKASPVPCCAACPYYYCSGCSREETERLGL
ncbi:hypothetical protein WJX74_000336 [Apatococcus lobatus]|uniref:Uncharacterized protein n=1 Tax=Apatococcus lobatus TaxID=904363 RepID=A0AAW1QXJ5_9CHLO